MNISIVKRCWGAGPAIAGSSAAAGRGAAGSRHAGSERVPTRRPGRRTALLALLAAASLALSLAVAACGDDDDKGVEAAAAAAQPGTAPASAGVVLLVPHAVEDFDRWKPVFEEHRAVRQQYGGSRDLVYRDLDDPNNVTVYMTYPTAADAEAFFNDPSLAEAMARAGVQPPLPPPWELLREIEVVDYENPGSGVAGGEEGGVLLVIRHRMADFDSWKPVFDEVEAVRREHGATGHRLYTPLDDPNEVLAYESYPSEEAARAFWNDPRLREAMERAGLQEGTLRWWLRTLDQRVEY